MSKSLGNFVTVHDMLQTVDGQVLRFFLATQQYRKPINFTEKAIHDAEVNLKYLKIPTVFRWQNRWIKLSCKLILTPSKKLWMMILIRQTEWLFCLTWLNGLIQAIMIKPLRMLLKNAPSLRYCFRRRSPWWRYRKLIEERQAARANKDFATADRIRDELAAQGIKLLDTKEGVRWTRD